MKTFDQLISRNKEKLQNLEALLGYKFANRALLQKALIHSSFAFEQLQEGQNNETLEFLGDAVLDLAVSDILFNMYPGIREGELTKIRARLVKEATLAKMAKTFTLGDFIELGKGEESSLGRKKSSILACAFEALLGAIYLDRGYENTLLFIRSHFTPLLPAKKEGVLLEDAKSDLQEKIQEELNQAPTYHLDAEDGPAHAKMFTVSVRFMDEVLGVGSGSSKKVAEQRAAEAALGSINSWWGRLKK
jgi:ribonuclease-3